MLGTIK